MFSTKRLVFALLCLLVLVSFAPVPTPAALRVAGVPLVGPEIACAQPIQVCDPKDPLRFPATPSTPDAKDVHASALSASPPPASR